MRAPTYMELGTPRITDQGWAVPVRVKWWGWWVLLWQAVRERVTAPWWAWPVVIGWMVVVGVRLTLKPGGNPGA